MSRHDWLIELAAVMATFVVLCLMGIAFVVGFDRQAESDQLRINTYRPLAVNVSQLVASDANRLSAYQYLFTKNKNAGR